MSVTQKIKQTLNQYPHITFYLERGLINYRALARDVAKKLKLKNIDAIATIINRIAKDYHYDSLAIRKIIAGSRIELRSDVCVVTIYGSFQPTDVICKVSTPEITTVIFDEKGADEFLQKLNPQKIVKIYRNMSLISVISPPEIADTSGVIAELLTLLASYDINIIELLSSHNYTLIVIPSEISINAYKILHEFIQNCRKL